MLLAGFESHQFNFRPFSATTWNDLQKKLQPKILSWINDNKLITVLGSRELIPLSYNVTTQRASHPRSPDFHIEKWENFRGSSRGNFLIYSQWKFRRDKGEFSMWIFPPLFPGKSPRIFSTTGVIYYFCGRNFFRRLGSERSCWVKGKNMISIEYLSIFQQLNLVLNEVQFIGWSNSLIKRPK